MENLKNVRISDATANPAPLGLFAFGICTVLLNLINTGMLAMDAMVLCMGLFYGGVIQVFVGVMEAKKGNSFGLAAFTSYGIFWISFVAIQVLPASGWMKPASADAMIAFLVMWGIFSVIMFLSALALSRLLQILFGAVVLLFLLLIIGNGTGETSIIVLAGYEGIACGMISLYAGTAFLLNEMYGKMLLPV